MGVYIPKMKVPETCGKCLDVGWHYVFECNLDDAFGIRLPSCPLVELPLHGRLIDADALIKQMNDNVKKTNNARYAWVDELDISLAPTIIESEEENG